ncbi:DUF2213 domain (PUBMED:21183074) [Commensalibacter communis]|uniref:DUF2213 domain (PUBMED:21183074) n=1 Tax=Commensalibacter communis TaxID=2972786 RepID=A0A9W4TNL8_9PROT|nr:DUF2213 domain-containing protein [Commensalibacter communis]CAI3941905.1 DUF2213 domain (PUBMED:21183074) [Commensalibacter communis]CAI3944732.1 DUF2213 domain (PUBMED:21183074) [Commensalibacter communis]CAI3958940.1 DUF2213 domain (PUBMED:21183074) [Commensalibacter communis]CAI3961095.1 DUF2213 domain (PUBMED:21183074) [Commensalibacter communis]
MTKLAYDKLPVKFSWQDEDGRLFIDKTPISKAVVNSYYGCEIPDAEKLGWDAHKSYNLLRPPDELERAAPTFNRLPVMLGHVHVTAENPHSEQRKGTMGERASFEFPYLFNSMAVWDEDAIAGIKDGTTREISCAYRYDVDPTSGEYEGQPYDGIMRNIRGNHVALVEKGRAGPDVYAWDSKSDLNKGNQLMATISKTARYQWATKVSELLKSKKLAMDASPEDVDEAVKKAEDEEEQEPSQAQDNSEEDTSQDNENTDPPEPAKNTSEDEGETVVNTPTPVSATKGAMDSAMVEKIVNQRMAIASKEFDKRLNEQRIRLKAAEQARIEVSPIIGNIVAQDAAYDDAASIYLMGLNHLGVDSATLPKDANVLRTMFTQINAAKQQAAYSSRPLTAQDSSSRDAVYHQHGIKPMKKASIV